MPSRLSFIPALLPGAQSLSETGPATSNESSRAPDHLSNQLPSTPSFQIVADNLGRAGRLDQGPKQATPRKEATSAEGHMPHFAARLGKRCGINSDAFLRGNQIFSEIRNLRIKEDGGGSAAEAWLHLGENGHGATSGKS